MNNDKVFNHLPDGAYYTSTKGYSGLSSLDKFTTDAPLIAIARRGKLKNTHIPHKIRLQLKTQTQ
jgi:hypothetical protein